MLVAGKQLALLLTASHKVVKPASLLLGVAIEAETVVQTSI